MNNRLLTVAIGLILLILAAVPMGFLLYGGGATALGGVLMLACLILIQLPVFVLFRRMGWIPTQAPRDDSASEE